MDLQPIDLLRINDIIKMKIVENNSSIADGTITAAELECIARKTFLNFKEVELRDINGRYPLVISENLIVYLDSNNIIRRITCDIRN